MNPGTVEILDTTLRDGSKLPFVVLDPHDRLVIARQLAVLGVDVIDAGYPAASREERESVSLIAREVRGPVIAALCRATEDDAAAALAILSEAARPRLHLFLHTSPVFLKDVLRVSAEGALRLIVHCLEAVPAGQAEVQFSFGEIGQAERHFLLEAVRAGSSATCRRWLWECTCTTTWDWPPPGAWQRSRPGPGTWR
jgi:2-isopropylmalate synthase